MTGRPSLNENAPEGTCPACGGALRFDPLLVGDTVGGLTLRGWDVCTACGKGWHAGRRAVTHEQWKLAGGGLSVDAGHARIRLDGGDHGVKVRLAARIATLPALEELRDLVAVLVEDQRGFPGAQEKLARLLERSRPAANAAPAQGDLFAGGDAA